MDLTWWQIVLGIVVGLILLMILVIIHELGHAIAAVRNGVDVKEFGLGFPPRAKALGKIRIPAGKKYRASQDKAGKTLLTLNWLLPLGGFCQMKGESDDAKGEGTYGSASFWSKTKILFAGVIMNVVAAMVIFTILAWIGMPKIAPNQFYITADNHGQQGVVAVADVVKDSPAEKAGLKKGETIVAMSQEKVHESQQVSDFTKAHAGETVTVGILRDNKTEAVKVRLNDTQSAAKTGYLGVSMMQTQSETIKATWSAPLVGIVDTLQFIWLTIAGLGQMLAGLGVGLGPDVEGGGGDLSQLAVGGFGS